MIKILVTGFGAFPGVPANPCSALLARLRRKSRSLRRFGIVLELRELTVVYAGLPARVARLAQEIKPDVLLQFGVAGGRNVISVEMQARNLSNTRTRDAAGRHPPTGVLIAHGQIALKTRIPAARIVAGLRRAGIASELSRDAGDYVCNASFYHALRLANVPYVGFIHIPHPCAVTTKDNHPSFDDIVKAAEIALIVIARHARERRA